MSLSRSTGANGATPPKERTVTVLQGEIFISDDPNEVLSTILGSCVAVCLWDAQMRIGGMNHFLLPDSAGRGSETIKYGTHAMELLINGLLRRNASRARLQAKLFGGAQMVSQFRDIGQGNIVFARDFLRAEGIPCVAESLGGTEARRVKFWATTGQARMLAVPRTDAMAVRRAPAEAPMPTGAAPDITLF
jgi:chemotaxis protein CheD